MTWWQDLCLAIGFIAGALAEHVRRRRWEKRRVDDLEHENRAYVGEIRSLYAEKRGLERRLALRMPAGLERGE